MAAVGFEAGAAADADKGPAQLRRNVDPRDVEIQRLRRQLELASKSASSSSREDPFLALAAQRLPTAQSAPPAHAESMITVESSVTSSEADLPSSVRPSSTGTAERDLAARAATSAPSSGSAASSLSPRPSSADHDTFSATTIWPLGDKLAPKASGRGQRTAVGRAGASVTAIATGHAESSSAVPVRFSQMDKAMVVKKALGPGIVALRGSGSAAYAATVGSRLSAMTRAADIMAVRALPT
jgi:hypothetical protein